MVLSFLNWNDIELRACGPKDIETEALKKITDYGGDPDHRVVKWFWEIFDEFDQERR